MIDHGHLDAAAYDAAELVLGTTFNGLSKADRMIYGHSRLNRAMLITGVYVDVSGNM